MAKGILHASRSAFKKVLTMINIVSLSRLKLGGLIHKYPGLSTACISNDQDDREKVFVSLHPLHSYLQCLSRRPLIRITSIHKEI